MFEHVDHVPAFGFPQGRQRRVDGLDLVDDDLPFLVLATLTVSATLSGRLVGVNAIWALAMFEGLVRRRYPDLDFQGRVRAYLNSELIEAVRVATG